MGKPPYSCFLIPLYWSGTIYQGLSLENPSKLVLIARVDKPDRKQDQSN